MKTIKIIITMLTIAVVSMVSATHAAVLSFDDVTTVGSKTIPDGYGGLVWSNMKVLHKDAFPSSGYDNGTVSGNYTALNLFGNAAWVYGSAFDFTGAYLTAAWGTGLNINLKGYNSGSLIYDQTVVVDSDGPTWFNFNFNNINVLVFDSFGGAGDGATQFAMDDFTYVIPEPASVGLIALVSVCGVFVRRRLMI